MEVFVTKTRSQNIEKLLLKTRYLKLMNLALYCVWEDARVWALWNHSFDMLHYNLGALSCFFHPESPQGAQLGVGSVQFSSVQSLSRVRLFVTRCRKWEVHAVADGLTPWQPLFTDILCPHVVPQFLKLRVGKPWIQILSVPVTN